MYINLTRKRGAQSLYARCKDDFIEIPLILILGCMMGGGYSAVIFEICQGGARSLDDLVETVAGGEHVF